MPLPDQDTITTAVERVMIGYSPGSGATYSTHHNMACAALDFLVTTVHSQNVNVGWWHDLSTEKPLNRNVGEMLMLVTSELAEAATGVAQKLADDKLPHRSMFEVEMADAMIRVLDMAGGLNTRLGVVSRELMARPMPADIADESTSELSALMGVAVRVSLAMEGDRKRQPHHFYPDILAFHVELARVIEAIVMVARKFKLDLPGAVAEKLAYNAQRADHKQSERRQAGGKRY